MDYWAHGETRDGEVFLGNVRKSEISTARSWKTARVGDVAYNVANERLDDFVPVFVSAEEYNEHFGIKSGKSL